MEQLRCYLTGGLHCFVSDSYNGDFQKGYNAAMRNVINAFNRAMESGQLPKLEVPRVHKNDPDAHRQSPQVRINEPERR